MLALLGDDRHADLIAPSSTYLGQGDLATPDGNVTEDHVLIEELQTSRALRKLGKGNLH